MVRGAAWSAERALYLDQALSRLMVRGAAWSAERALYLDQALSRLMVRAHNTLMTAAITAPAQPIAAAPQNMHFFADNILL